jgi:hypothetical protein
MESYLLGNWARTVSENLLPYMHVLPDGGSKHNEISRPMNKLRMKN